MEELKNCDYETRLESIEANRHFYNIIRSNAKLESKSKYEDDLARSDEILQRNMRVKDDFRQKLNNER